MLIPDIPARAGECVNLRPDAVDPDGYLVPALPPAIAMNRAWRVVGAYVADNGTVMELLADGAVLGACSHGLDEDAPEPYIVAEGLDGEIAGSYPCHDGYMILTTTTMYHVVYDNDTMMLRCEEPVDTADYRTVGITVSSETSVSLPVAGFKLSGSYDSSSVRLDASDAVKLTRTLSDAYGQGCADATASGWFIAPVLARYKLFDSRGNMLFESVPKLMVPTGRHDRSMTTTLGVESGFSRVLAGGVTVPLYKIGVTVPASACSVADGRVARLEVQLTPQLHSVDGNLGAVHRMQSAVNATTLTATMPGCDVSGKATGRYRRSVLRALAVCDSLFSTVMTVENPFDNKEDIFTVEATARTVDEERSLLSRASVDSRPLWLNRCLLPHTVSGTVGYRDGEVTLLGNLAVKLFGGHDVEYYVNHGSVSDDIETAAAVTFSDGRRAVNSGVSRMWRTMMLSPLIVYPDSSAVSIELQICDSTGKNRGLTLPLTPCGRFACYLGESMWPLGFDDDVGEFYLPRDTMVPEFYPGNIVVFGGDRPDNHMTGREVGLGRINAIVPVRQPSSSAWESSRSRFNVMGSDGIFSMSMSGRSTVSPVRLDSRPVMEVGAVSTVTGGYGCGRIYAIAGGDLVCVEGNRVRTLVGGIEATMLVWNRRRDELLAIIPSGNSGIMSRALVMHAMCGGWSTRLLPAISAVFSNAVATRLTSVADGMVYNPEREVGAVVRSKYVTELKQPVTHIVRGVPFIDEVTVDLTAGNIDGSLTIAGHHGRGPARVFTRLDVTGELNRPIAHHTLMPARYRMTATIDALLSADARIGKVGIHV